MLRYFKRISQISIEENFEAKKSRIKEISIKENVEAKEASVEDTTAGENNKVKEASIDEIVQLRNYIVDMHYNKEFEELQGLSKLALKLVVTKRNKVYPLVYMLVTLGLTLLIATAIVKRVFSAMNIVKNPLRNQIGD